MFFPLKSAILPKLDSGSHFVFEESKTQTRRVRFGFRNKLSSVQILTKRAKDFFERQEKPFSFHPCLYHSRLFPRAMVRFVMVTAWWTDTLPFAVSLRA